MRKTHNIAWVLTISLTLASSVYAAASASELLEKLASSNAQDRAYARQYLPRECAQVVPQIVSLLSSDNELVRSTAFQVLAEFANQVSVPGREEDRTLVTTSLMTLLEPHRSPELKQLGLRLLPLVVPQGADLSPLTLLLDDAEMREKARAALVEIGTPDAAAVLQGYLDRASPDFTCAIFYGLAQMKDVASLDASLAYAKSEHATVRAAAGRALAWTGDLAYLETVKQIVAHSDQATRSDAVDAWLRLVRAVELKGENRLIAVSEYRDMLGSDEPKVRMAGLAGLGRIGDGPSVADMLKCIKNADTFEWAAAIEALDQMSGDDVCKSIIDEYASASQETQLALLSVLGRKHNPITLDLLKQIAAEGDAEFRVIAIRALGESVLAQAIEPLNAAGRSADAADRQEARMALINLGNALGDGGNHADAGAAYLAAIEVIPTEEKALLRRALVGLTVSPCPAAFEVAKMAKADAEMHDLAVPLLMSIGDKLLEANEKDKAKQLFEAAVELEPASATMQILAERLMGLGSRVDWSSRLGVIRHWWLVGPFELGENHAGWNRPYIDEPNVDLRGRYMSGKRRLEWRPVVADDHGVVNMAAALGQHENVIGYAYAEIEVTDAMNAVLRIGAADSEKVWINGEKVFELFAGRPMTIDEDTVSIKLKAGTNAILMKVWQHTHKWEFRVRVATPEDDRPVVFMQQQLQP